MSLGMVTKGMLCGEVEEIVICEPDVIASDASDDTTILADDGLDIIIRPDPC